MHGGIVVQAGLRPCLALSGSAPMPLFARRLNRLLRHYLDLLGTFAFAVCGAFRAVRYELDLLGVVVLGVATGVGGGIVRDVSLGINPPLVLIDQSYVALCVVGALAVFFAAPRIARRWDYVLAADALGLAVCTAIGAARAEEMAAVPLTIVLMGVLTACGGGTICDVLVREIPAALSHDFYATAALIGAAAYLALRWLAWPDSWRLFGTIAVTLGIRAAALRYAISLPRVQALPDTPLALTRAQSGAASTTMMFQRDWGTPQIDPRQGFAGPLV
jgi:uncharacterized membrane protein YeiH